MLNITTDYHRRMLIYLAEFYKISLPPSTEISSDQIRDSQSEVVVLKLQSLFNLDHYQSSRIQAIRNRTQTPLTKRAGPESLEQEQIKRRMMLQAYALASARRQQTSSTTHPPNSQSSVGLANTNVGPRVSNSSNGVVMVNGSAQPSREQVQQGQKETTGGGTVATTSPNPSPRVQPGNSRESR